MMGVALNKHKFTIQNYNAKIYILIDKTIWITINNWWVAKQWKQLVGLNGGLDIRLFAFWFLWFAIYSEIYCFGAVFFFSFISFFFFPPTIWRSLTPKRLKIMRQYFSPCIPRLSKIYWKKIDTPRTRGAKILEVDP